MGYGPWSLQMQHEPFGSDLAWWWDGGDHREGQGTVAACLHSLPDSHVLLLLLHLLLLLLLVPPAPPDHWCSPSPNPKRKNTILQSLPHARWIAVMGSRWSPSALLLITCWAIRLGLHLSQFHMSFLFLLISASCPTSLQALRKHLELLQPYHTCWNTTTINQLSLSRILPPRFYEQKPEAECIFLLTPK